MIQIASVAYPQQHGSNKYKSVVMTFKIPLFRSSEHVIPHQPRIFRILLRNRLEEVPSHPLGYAVVNLISQQCNALCVPAAAPPLITVVQMVAQVLLGQLPATDKR